MTALAVCRFAHFLPLMFVFGVSAYLRMCAPETLRAALARTLRPSLRVAALVAFVTGALWLALEAASMADSWPAAANPGALGAVLADTAFGRAWIVHLSLLLVLLAAAFRQGGGSTGFTLISGLSLASLGLAGHAVMQAGPEGVAHRMNDALHLLCGGAWIGALVPFLLSLAAFRRRVHAREAVAGMIRFSFYGHFVVAGVVATGVVNVALTSGLPLPPDTPYRALLDVKIGVVAVMIALALINRYALVPRLSALPGAFAALRAFAFVNVGLGTLAVALVSVFGLLNPA